MPTACGLRIWVLYETCGVATGRTSEGDEGTNDVDLRHHTPQTTSDDASSRSNPNNSLDE